MKASELSPGDVGLRAVVSSESGYEVGSEFGYEVGTLVWCEHGDIAIMYDDGDIYHLSDRFDITVLGW